MGPRGRAESFMEKKEAASLKPEGGGGLRCLLPHPPVSPRRLASQRRGGDRVDGVAARRHALEGQRGGDVTAVGR